MYFRIQTNKKFFMKALLCAGFVFAFANLFSQANFYQWSKQVGGSNSDGVVSMTSDTSGNTYTLGIVGGPTPVDLDPGPGVFNSPATFINLYLLKLDNMGNFMWAKTWDMPYGVGYSSVTLDKTGNIYIGGSAVSVIDFDPGPGVANLSNNRRAAYVLKLDQQGDFVWVKGFHKPSSASSSWFEPRCRDLTTDTLGNIYCLLNYTDTIDVNPGTAIQNYLPGSNSIGSSTVVKLDASGNFVWAGSSYSGSSNSMYDLKCIEVSPSGSNVFIAGDWWSTNSSASSELTYAVLNSTGAQTVSRQSSNTGFANVSAMDLASDGNLLIAGQFAGTVNFNSMGTFNQTTTGSYDVYLVKYSPFGSLLWIKTMGGTNADYCYGIDSDPDGNAYLTGNFTSTVMDCDPGTGVHNLNLIGGQDAYVMSLDASGTYRWAKSFGGSDNENPQRLNMDAGKNIYISGTFDGYCDFDPDAGTANLGSNGGNDAFVMKLTNCIYNAPDICLVTVDSMANNNMIYWDEDQYPLADSFIVYRYDALTTNFLRIGAVAKSNPDNFLIDTARTVGGPNGGDPQYSSYRYKLAIRGVCGDLGTMGLYHESIFIQQNFQNFNWNAYAIEGQPSPATGYQFLRDNTSSNNWQVLVNTGGLSTTDPNYASYPNGNWRVDALGFTCSSDGSSRLGNGPNQVMGAINTSRSNIKSPTSASGIKEIKQLPVTVYPNPASDRLMIDFPSMSEEMLIEVQNVLGETVYSQKSSQLKNTISCTGMGAGIYFVRVSSGKGSATRKITIQ
jgi:hypothetical protein